MTSNVTSLPTAADGGLIWETPPAPNQVARSQYSCEALALRARPGEWAVIRVFPLAKKKTAWSIPTRVNAGKMVDFPAGEFEACARTVDGEVRVYARYVGTTASQAVQA